MHLAVEYKIHIRKKNWNFRGNYFCIWRLVSTDMCKLAVASVSKWVFVRNCSCENVFRLYSHFHTNQTPLHSKRTRFEFEAQVNSEMVFSYVLLVELYWTTSTNIMACFLKSDMRPCKVVFAVAINLFVFVTPKEKNIRFHNYTACTISYFLTN